MSDKEHGEQGRDTACVATSPSPKAGAKLRSRDGLRSFPIRTQAVLDAVPFRGRVLKHTEDKLHALTAFSLELELDQDELADCLRTALLAFARDDDGEVWSDSLIARTETALKKAGVKL